MEQTESPSSSIFATEPIGRLIAKFAIPCVISLLVNSLYNIVDQIFIGWGVGYLGNGAINSMIRADGSPKYAMFSMALGAVINTIFDPVFIFIFHMGVQGAAIATVMGQVASFVFSVIYLPRFKALRFDLGSFRLQPRTCVRIASFGISSFITQFAITIVMALNSGTLGIDRCVQIITELY